MRLFTLFFIVSFSTLAADPFKFEGAYSVVPEKCQVKGNRAFSRAVVRSTSHEVLIQLYGKDGATGLSIPSRNSKEYNPNFDFGNPVKYIITKSNCIGRVLKSKVIYQYGNRKKETVENYRLEKNGDSLFYEEETKDGDFISCELNLNKY